MKPTFNHMAMRPKAVMCYICGREYGTNSISIHIPQCIKKWEAQESLKPYKERRPVPQPPKQFEQAISGAGKMDYNMLEELNNNAFNAYNEKALLPCDICGRTFREEALHKHMKGCKGGNYKVRNQQNVKPQNDQFTLPNISKISTANNSSQLPSINHNQTQLPSTTNPKLKQMCQQCNQLLLPKEMQSHNCGSQKQQLQRKGSIGVQRPSLIKNPFKQNQISNQKSKVYEQPQQPVIMRPKTVVCYICGREFGTASISIHIPQCKIKFMNEQAKLPQKQRKPLPSEPQNINKFNDNLTRQELDDYNMGAMEQWKNEALSRCPNCSRTFNPEAFKHHQKACTADKPMASINIKINKNGQQTQSNVNQQQEFDENVNVPLIECQKCGRSFAENRISKHEQICNKPQKQNKIKKINPVTGEIEKIAPLKYEKVKQTEQQQIDQIKNQNQNKWKEKHQDFVDNMKYMKQMKQIQQQGGDIKQLPPPPKSQNPDYVECPTCCRKFNQQAAERHIPSCKNVINKPKPVKSGARILKAVK